MAVKLSRPKSVGMSKLNMASGRASTEALHQHYMASLHARTQTHACIVKQHQNYCPQTCMTADLRHLSDREIALQALAAEFPLQALVRSLSGAEAGPMPRSGAPSARSAVHGGRSPAARAGLPANRPRPPATRPLRARPPCHRPQSAVRRPPRAPSAGRPSAGPPLVRRPLARPPHPPPAVRRSPIAADANLPRARPPATTAQRQAPGARARPSARCSSPPPARPPACRRPPAVGRPTPPTQAPASQPAPRTPAGPAPHAKRPSPTRLARPPRPRMPCTVEVDWRSARARVGVNSASTRGLSGLRPGSRADVVSMLNRSGLDPSSICVRSDIEQGPRPHRESN